MKEHVANIFPKALAKDTSEFLREKLGVIALASSSQVHYGDASFQGSFHTHLFFCRLMLWLLSGGVVVYTVLL